MTRRAAVRLAAVLLLVAAPARAASGPRLVLPAPPAAAHEAPPAGVAHLHDPLDRVLHADVRDGVVDWAALRARDRSTLEIYLDAMSRVDPAALAPAERAAYGLNVYEATLLVVACGQREGWSPAERDFAALREPLVRTREGRVSLDSLERALLGPAARDPRLRVLLWRGARSSPPLPPRAWRGADLDRALDAAMRAFLADPARNRFDRAARTADLARVFDWYAADFGGPGGVRQAVGRWTGQELGGWTLRFLDFDWRLAGLPGR